MVPKLRSLSPLTLREIGNVCSHVINAKDSLMAAYKVVDDAIDENRPVDFDRMNIGRLLGHLEAAIDILDSLVLLELTLVARDPSNKV